MSTTDFSDRSKWQDGWQTRGGRPVRIYAVDGAGGYPIHGAYAQDDNCWKAMEWAEDGFLHVDGLASNFDLVPRPVKRKGWGNVYPNERPEGFYIITYDTEGAAVRCRQSNCIACIPIEFYEGEGI